MKWFRFLFLLAVLAAVGCSRSSPPEVIEETDVATDEIDQSLESDALGEPAAE